MLSTPGGGCSRIQRAPSQYQSPRSPAASAWPSGSKATERSANGSGLAAIDAANTEFAAVAERADHGSSREDLVQVQAANDRFHSAILAAADNRFLAAPLSAMRAHNRRYENVYFADFPQLARLSADDLVTNRRIQGFDTNTTAALFDCISHFRGHVQEIINLTRMQLGERYKFYFVPQGKEQESAGI